MESSASANNVVMLVSTAFGVAAALLAISIPILQTDLVSRTWLLSSRALQAKRNVQYLYRWKVALEKTLYYLFHVYFPDLQERHLVEWYATEKELNDLIQYIVNPHQPTPRLLWVGLDVDQDDPRGEYYLYLLQQHASTGASSTGRSIIKVPLVAFGLKLQEAMEAIVTTTTLCFVADASSGLGTRWITGLLEACKVGVTLFKEPLWMATLAYLAQQRLVTTEKLQKIMFGLCRLEAWRLRDELGDAKTAVFTLPGQGAVPILLPLVQAAFPEDRHVFCYDGCVASVERAVALGLSPPPQPSSLSTSQKLLPKLETLLQWNYNPLVSIGTPIHPTKLPSAIPNFIEASRKLPLRMSGAVHAWMDSVDTFLQLKSTSTSNKSSNQLQQYLPYVCKMSLLLSTNPDKSCNTTTSLPTIPQDVSYSLSSLLQYMTGFHFKSRPFAPQVWEAAVDYWRNHPTSTVSPVAHVSATHHRVIEDCVFRHKSILIGDKTLPDTVLPALHWTLIQASKKSSCACCAPDEEDDEDEANGNGRNEESSNPFALPNDVAENGSSNGLVQRRPKFVDGKMGFAFDPTSFSKM